MDDQDDELFVLISILLRRPLGALEETVVGLLLFQQRSAGKRGHTQHNLILKLRQLPDDLIFRCKGKKEGSPPVAATVVSAVAVAVEETPTNWQRRLRLDVSYGFLHHKKE